MLLLQEKINTYIAFIESGELLQSYPPAKGKNPKIRINGLYELSDQGQIFIDRVTEVLKGVGIGLKFMLQDGSAVRH